MKDDPRGSLWRQWDLHLHTPSSFDYDDKSVSDKDLIDKLIAVGIAGVVVTDHHIIDVARMRHLQELATDRLVVFPGVEFRCELGGPQYVHYVGIFPEDSDLGDLWSKLQGQLDITPGDVAAAGDDRVYVPFTKGAEVIHKLGGIVSVHAGRKTNTFENITNADEFKQAVKEDLIRDHIDILEIGSTKDVDGYRRKVFPCLARALPLVIGSDSHNVRSYQRKIPCWIKADVSFGGLRHVLHEPESRVFLGDIPPQLERVRGNRTKYIRSISLAKCPNSPLKEQWFSGKTEFTHGLAAIIGNKGSGKSALADILGLLGDSPHGDSFSFLNSEKFRQPKGNKARHFDAEICWESDGTAKRNLDESVDGSSPESVQYIPQAYLESVCNELNTGTGNGFSRELMSVIFSHITKADRLGHDNLEGLLNYRTKETDTAIGLLRIDLTAAIADVVTIEEQLTPSHRKSLENHLAMKERELEAHDEAKPTPVLKPDSDPATAEANAQIEEKLDALSKDFSELEQEITSLNADRLRESRKIAAADRLLERVANLETQVKAFRNESLGDCAELGLDPDSVVRVQISRDLITQAKESSVTTLQEVVSTLDVKNPTGPAARKADKEAEAQALRDRLGEPQQKYQRYLGELETWTQRRAEIVGNATSSGTLEFYKQQLSSLSALPESLQHAKARCRDAAVEIYQKIASLAAVYRTVYQPVQEFIREHPLAKDHFELKFETAIQSVGFAEGLLELISQGRRGSFYGEEEGLARASQIVREADFSTEQGLVAFLEQVDTHLRCDMRQSPPEAVSVESQLKRNVTPNRLYEYLYSLGYLRPHYTLQWAGKEIEQLSPGERGTLLLVFYLLIDRSDIPLVIDQPEENLDNQTVYNILVPSIMEAKNRRQIFLVTHNPNLAVVCDADQVIHASLDKDNGNRISYTTGALENPHINRKVVDVLEGTRPAFDNRERKYHTFDNGVTP
jgi:histidinol phosphatase-like PHP family hydrolase/energy-coupling factor transporter ATP-binding protein EcfA2